MPVKVEEPQTANIEFPAFPLLGMHGNGAGGRGRDRASGTPTRRFSQGQHMVDPAKGETRIIHAMENSPTRAGHEVGTCLGATGRNLPGTELSEVSRPRGQPRLALEGAQSSQVRRDGKQDGARLGEAVASVSWGQSFSVGG